MSNGPRIEVWAIDRIKPYEKNPRTLPETAIAKVSASLSEFGFQKPIVVDEAGTVIAGHVMLAAAQRAGIARVPVAISSLTPAQAKAYRLADNRTAQESDWLDDLLRGEIAALDDLDFDLNLTGFDSDELAKLLAEDAGEGDGEGAGKLSDKFLIPPFSVLNAREGWWQERKRQWLALGIVSELGRGAPIGGAPMPLDRKRAANG